MGAGRSSAAGGGQQASQGSGERGLGGPLAAKFEEVAAACVVCSQDSRRFVNDSEECLGAFARALRHIKNKRFADERAIFEAIPDKDKVVHFLLDCVRNRFPDRSRVSEIKALLVEQSPSWKRCFEEHTQRCAKCKTVDLTRPAAPPPQPDRPPPAKVRWPVPFVVEVLALCACGVPALAKIMGDSCAWHWIMFFLGILLMLPWIIVQVLRRRRGQGWLLSRFVAGRYAAVGPRHRPLPRLWRPSTLQWWAEPEAEGGPVKVRAENYCFCMPRRFFLEPAAEVKRVPVSAATSPAPTLSVTASELGWESQAVLEDSGELSGLLRACRFDGSYMFVSTAQPQLWAKMGLWRWEWVSKALLCLASLGLCSSALAAALPPHLDFGCVQLPSYRRLPLRAFFLMDGSGSVGTSGWEAEKKAVIGIIDAFQQVYGSGKDAGDLHIGACEFSSDVSHVVAMSADVAGVSAKIKKFSYDAGGTVYSTAFDMCQGQLDKYTAAGNRTYDVCVIVTDGEGDVKDRRGVQQHLKADTSLFGIFVGSDTTGEKILKDISTPGFFVPATDYKELQKKAREVAENIAKGGEEAVTRESSCAKKASDKRGGGHADEPPPPRWLYLFLLGLVPLVAWWVYLLLQRLKRKARAPEIPRSEVRQPLRLRAAGANEGRDRE